MKIEKNAVVGFTYTLTNPKTNEVLDESGDRPLEFIVGHGNIIPGLENKMIGMSVGDKAVIEVAPEDGYGAYDDNAVQVLPAEQFMGLELKVGMPLYGQSEDGHTVQVTVKDFNDKEVTIDHNHPLAGATLSFDLEVVSVREGTTEEVLSGQVDCGKEKGGHCGSGCGCGH